MLAAIQLTLVSGLIASFASTTSGSPTPGSDTALIGRQESNEYGGQLDWGTSSCKGDDGHLAYLSFSSCQVCTATKDGFPTCDTTNYVSTVDSPGSYGNNGCNIPSYAADFDGCSNVDSYSISTPRGFAKYFSNGGGDCGGQMVTEDGYVMTCYHQSENYSVFCGLEYACNNFLQCIGVNNADVCPPS